MKIKEDSEMDSPVKRSMISRTHCKLKQTIDRDDLGRYKWQIVDNSSLNGIFLNNEKITQSVLSEGDIVTFGGGGNKSVGFVCSQPDSELVFKMYYRHRSWTHRLVYSYHLITICHNILSL